MITSELCQTTTRLLASSKLKRKKRETKGYQNRSKLNKDCKRIYRWNMGRENQVKYSRRKYANFKFCSLSHTSIHNWIDVRFRFQANWGSFLSLDKWLNCLIHTNMHVQITRAWKKHCVCGGVEYFQDFWAPSFWLFALLQSSWCKCNTLILLKRSF